MRKRLLFIGMFLLSFCTYGQIITEKAQTPGSTPTESTAGTDFKPDAGDNTFEVNFNPFSATPVSLNFLKFRYFLSEDLAARAGLSLGIRGGGDNSSFEYAVLPGIEKHFRGTDRLSPFIGAELIIAGRSSSYSSTNNGTTRRISGAWGDGSNRGFFNFGLNALIGCDYYFSKNIYMGIEAGYGFNLISTNEITTTIIPASGATVITTQQGGSAFNLGPNFNSAIRLGFAF
jgi:hypothetical protein